MLETEISTPTQGSLRTSSGESLPLQQTAVDVRIDGPVARVVVKQTFNNTRSLPIEAIYSFPLPPEASVYRMEFRIGARVVRGVIKERAEARRAYRAAKAEGRAVTLLEEDAPAVFTLSVANVPAGERIDVHLEYQEVLRYDDGRFIFVFPMVAPDLYRDGPAPAAALSTPPPRMPSPDRPADLTLEVRVARTPAEGLRCRSHDVHPEVGPDGAAFMRLGGGGPIPNRDFVLEWQVPGDGVRPDVRFEPRDGGGTFLLTLAPARGDANVEVPAMGNEARPIRCGNCGALITDPAAVREVAGFGPLVTCKHCGAMLAPATTPIVRATRPRDVAILLDRSASMRKALPQARRLAMAVVEALLPGDAVTALTFDHDRAVFDGQLRWVAAAPEVARRIDAFLDVPARGGSDIAQALALAGKAPIRDGRTRTIVLVTDGAVGNTAKLLRRLPELIGNDTRLFVVGVGAAVNRGFLESLARAGRGASEIVSPREGLEVVQKRLARKVLAGGPVLTDIALSWDGANPTAIHPRTLPDLYGSEPLRVLGRYTGSGVSRLVINAITASGQPFRQELEVRPPDTAAGATEGLERLWAKREVDMLLERPGRSGDDQALVLALQYSLATRLTSLIAEDTEVSVQKVRIPKARLQVRSGPDAGKELVLGPGTTRVGRDKSADFVLREGGVSRMHLEITADASGYRLRDLSSVNGTHIERGGAVREAKLERQTVLLIGGQHGVHVAFDLIPDEWLEVLPTQTVQVGDEQADPDDDAPRAAMPPPQAAARAPAPRPAASLDSPRGVRPHSMPLNLMSPPSMPRAMPPSPGGMPMPPAMSLRAPSHPPGVVASRSMDTPLPRSYSPAYDELAPVAAARRTTQARTMSGSIEEVPIEDLLQLFKTARKSGVLVVRSEGDVMKVHLRKGEPFRATLNAADAPLGGALRELSLWTKGLFDLEPPEDAPGQHQSAPIPQAPALLPSGPAYPEAELTFVRHRLKGELDLAILVDETQSMAPYIANVRARMVELLNTVAASPLCKSLRIAIVSYRDHPPEDMTYASRVVLPFTSDVAAAERAVQTLVAQGGGDGPESATDGLFDVVRLDWRPDSSKVAVWFGDAPPHGVEPEGDHFANGCPCGNDWFAQAESCREMGIAIYAIGCLPGLRQYRAAEQVYRTVARSTRGMYLALHEAGLLSTLIGGAAEAALDGERIDEHVFDLASTHAAALAETDETERARWILDGLRRANVQPRSLREHEEKAEFRALVLADVEASLNRLRVRARVAW